MNFFRQRAAQTLPEWLESATGRLVPSAQARIRPEIEAHYAEAVQAGLEHGATEPAAQAAALADLGNPCAAARRFRQKLLTENDAAVLAALIKKSPRAYFNSVVGLLILLSALSAVVSFWLWLEFKLTLPSLHGICGLCVLYALDTPGVYFGRAGRGGVAAIDPPPSSLIQLIRVHFLINLILGLFCLGLNWSVSWADPTELASLPLYFAVFFFSGLKLFRLRQKLLAAVEDDLPPGDRAAA
jgi:hypothetical protein